MGFNPVDLALGNMNALRMSNARLKAENDKLRVLVRDMAAVICVYDQCVTVDDCPPALPMFAEKMRELGIEVDA